MKKAMMGLFAGLCLVNASESYSSFTGSLISKDHAGRGSQAKNFVTIFTLPINLSINDYAELEDFLLTRPQLKLTCSTEKDENSYSASAPSGQIHLRPNEKINSMRPYLSLSAMLVEPRALYEENRILSQQLYTQCAPDNSNECTKPTQFTCILTAQNEQENTQMDMGIKIKVEGKVHRNSMGVDVLELPVRAEEITLRTID